MTATLRINNIAKILGVIASQPGRPRPLTQPGGRAKHLAAAAEATENEQRARFIGYPTNRYKLIADACGFGNGLRRLPLTTYRTIRFRPSGVSRAFLCTFIQSSRESLNAQRRGSRVAAGAGAQQPMKLRTIGFLGATTAPAQKKWTDAFVQRLHELDWIEGRSIAIEYRWAEGRTDRVCDVLGCA